MHLPMQETQVQSLGWENPLEEEMATHSSILARRILWTENPGGLQSMGSQKKLDTTLLTYTHTHTHQESLSIPEAILSPSQPSLLS